MPAVIRLAQVRDIACLEEIENAADTLLVRFLDHVDWESAPSGEARASMTGFILVAADSEDDDAFGFVHVLELEGFAHLEQLSVVPERGRQGVGRELVDASLTEAARRGFESMTLRTYADVPWNAPFLRNVRICGERFRVAVSPRAAERRSRPWPRTLWSTHSDVRSFAPLKVPK